MGRWRLKSPASISSTQPFIQAQTKENIKAPRHWPCVANSPVTNEFPAQMASNTEMFHFDDVIIYFVTMDDDLCNTGPNTDMVAGDCATQSAWH